ncbi:OFA family MFS transporter [Angustibacter aerolatus]
MSVLDRERTVAGPGFNRWVIPPAALAIHLSIGEVYAFSVFKTSLVAHFDVSGTAIAWIFSIAIVMLGLSAAFGGTWMERNGPRKAMVLSAACFSTGLIVGSIGIATGQLWLLYLGYGVIGGIGLGIGYISPVSTLIKWFPDRPGLATGLAIMGFGGGALVASPLSNALLSRYDGGYDPTAKGATADGHALAFTFLTLGLAYLVLMLFGAAIIRVPDDKGAGGADDGHGGSKAREGWGGAQVAASTAIRTPQFALLWIVLFCNVTAGIGILEQASPMIQDFFRDGRSSAVTAAAAGGFVGLLSIANMAGRFVWSTTSDAVGRKRIYMLYLGLGAVLYLLLLLVGDSSTVVFVVLTAGILSFYGGGFATVPAYLKDLFGTHEVGAIHGRLLTAWSAAGVAGPLIVNGIIDRSGTPGTLTSSAYHPALIVMVVLLCVGFAANLLIKPVDRRHFVGADLREPGERPAARTKGVRA